MSKVTYKKSIGMQIFYGFLALLVIYLTYVQLMPLDSILKIALFVGIGIYALVCCSLGIINVAQIMCPHCQSELYETIEKGNSQELKYRYCPYCGHEVEI